MPLSKTTPTSQNEVTILSRILSNGKGELTAEVAHYFLGLGFTEADKTRMHDLAVRNQAGTLAPQEQEELFGYAKAGCLLGILQSRARKRLKKTRKNRAS